MAEKRHYKGPWNTDEDQDYKRHRSYNDPRHSGSRGGRGDEDVKDEQRGYRDYRDTSRSYREQDRGGDRYYNRGQQRDYGSQRQGSYGRGDSGGSRGQREGFRGGNKRFGSSNVAIKSTKLARQVSNHSIGHFTNAFQLTLQNDAEIYLYSVRLSGRDSVLTASDYKRKSQIMNSAKVREITKGRESTFYFSDCLIVFEKEANDRITENKEITIDFENELYDISFQRQGLISASTLLEPSQETLVTRFFTSILNKVWDAVHLTRVGRTQYLSDLDGGRNEKRGWDIILAPTASCGYLIVADSHSRQLEGGTVEDVLNQRLSSDEIQNKLKGRICLTTYRAIYYRLLHVTGCTPDEPAAYASSDYFTKKGADGVETQTSVADYLKRTYNVTLRNPDSPIVVLETTRGSRSNGQVRIPAEVLLLANNKAPDGSTPREIKGARIKLNETMELRSLLERREVEETLAKFKVQIDTNPLDATKYMRSLPEDGQILWSAGGGGRGSSGFGRDFAIDMLKEYGMRSEVLIRDKWLPLFVMDDATINISPPALFDKLCQVLTELPIAMDRPRARVEGSDGPYLSCSASDVYANMSRFKGYIKEKITTHRKKHGIQFVVAILPGELVNNQRAITQKNEPIYRAIKQAGMEMDIPIQCIKYTTLNKFASRCWSKLYCALQAKILDPQQKNGIPWVVTTDIPGKSSSVAPFQDAKRLRTIGIATYNLNKRDVGIAMAANGNTEHTSAILSAGTAVAEHSINLVNIEKYFAKLWERLKLYGFERNRQNIPVPPSTLVIYRSGISEGQYKLLFDGEIASIRAFLCKELGKIELDEGNGVLRITRDSAAPMWNATHYIKFRAINEGGSPTEVKRQAELKEVNGSLVYTAELDTSQQLEKGHAFIIESELELSTSITGEVKGNVFGVTLKDEWYIEGGASFIPYITEMAFECLFLSMHYTNSCGEQKKVQVQLRETERRGNGAFINFGVASNFENASNFRFFLSRSSVCREISLLYMVTGNNTMRFFQLGNDDVRMPDRGSFIEDGVTRRVASGVAIQEFYLFCSNPKLGAPSPATYHVLLNETGWTPSFIASATYKMCHMYYNWPGTVKKPHLLMIAQRLAEQMKMYCNPSDRDASSEDPSVGSSEFEDRCRVLEDASSILMRSSLPL